MTKAEEFRHDDAPGQAHAGELLVADAERGEEPELPRYGLRQLRFAPEIESRYRAEHVELNIERVRLSHGTGILALIGFLIVDKLFGWMLQPPAADMILLFGLIPLLAVGMWLPRIRGDWRIRQAAMTANSLLIVGCLVAVVMIGRERVMLFPYEPLMLAVVYAYFLSGLMFAPAVLVGMTTLVAHVALLADFSVGGMGVYQAYYLLLFNAMGWIGLFLIERHQRSEFLLALRLRQRANFDPLTRVLNRGAFRTHLDRAWDLALREGKNIGVLLIDIDEFKRVNDSCGHLFGDDVLRHVGKRIRQAGRRSMDAAGRYGGDEFVVMLYDTTAEHFEQVAQTLQTCSDGLRCEGGGQAFPITLSVGGVLVKPRGRSTPRDALRVADDQLYKVKESGRDGWQVSVMI